MKKYTSLFLTLICALSLLGCSNKSMNYIIKNKPSVTGIVEEVYADHVIVYSEEADGYPNGSNWSISLNVENKDSYTNVVVGDEIVFYYDGMAMETDPLQVSTVYAITLKTPADRNKEEFGDLVPMIMVNGELYLDTGRESTIEVRCGMMDGEIISTVDGTEQPTKDNESNFGTGYGYQYGFQEGTIEIYMNDKWWIFATEEVRQEILIFEETWGITLTAEKITSTSAIIKCMQSAGEPTGELHTGSWYILENWTQENGWKEMPYVIDGEIGWTQEAWIIPMNDSCEWEINWEWLYGKLPIGKYRIGKEITDFRAAGDYDKAVYFVEFTIE